MLECSRFPRAVVVAAVALLVLHEHAHGLQPGTHPVRSAVLPGVSVELLVEKPASPCRRWTWGAESDCPATALGDLRVHWDGRNVRVPRSAFADLGTPRQAHLRRAPGGFILALEGGAGARGYQAELRFRGGRLEARRVWSVDSPDDFWEETAYRDPG